MKKGQIRFEPNVNVGIEFDGRECRTPISEIKNLNSFRAVRKAIDYELTRQVATWQEDHDYVAEKRPKENRGWNDDQEITEFQRGKEEVHDYRYFPDPDLLPVLVPDEWKEEIRQSLPELPDARRARWLADYTLPEYDVDLLNGDRAISDYTDRLFKLVPDAKTAANWVMGDVLRFINDQKIEIQLCKASPDNLAEIIQLVDQDLISHTSAKKVFEEVARNGVDPRKAVEKLGLAQVSDSDALDRFVEDVIETHPDEVNKFLCGKEKVFGFLMGRVMQASGGKANPGLVNRMLRKKLDALKSDS